MKHRVYRFSDLSRAHPAVRVECQHKTRSNVYFLRNVAELTVIARKQIFVQISYRSSFPLVSAVAAARFHSLSYHDRQVFFFGIFHEFFEYSSVARVCLRLTFFQVAERYIIKVFIFVHRLHGKNILHRFFSLPCVSQIVRNYDRRPAFVGHGSVVHSGHGSFGQKKA